MDVLLTEVAFARARAAGVGGAGVGWLRIRDGVLRPDAWGPAGEAAPEVAWVTGDLFADGPASVLVPVLGPGRAVFARRGRYETPLGAVRKGAGSPRPTHRVHRRVVVRACRAFQGADLLRRPSRAGLSQPRPPPGRWRAAVVGRRLAPSPEWPCLPGPSGTVVGVGGRRP